MFEQIKRTLGNMEGQYQAKTLVTAFISDVKDVEYSQKSGKPGQSLYLRHEETGEIAWVKFTGKGVEENPLSKADKGTTRDFLVWPFKPQDSPKTYLYCWIQRQTGQQAPQNTQQSYQHAAQGNKSSSDDVTITQILLCVERIATALERMADNGQSFEQKYDLNEKQTQADEDSPPF